VAEVAAESAEAARRERLCELAEAKAESSELRTKSIQLASAWAALEQQQRVDLRDSLEREAQLHELAGREANRAKAVELAEGERARRLSLPNAATPAQSEQPSAAGVALPLPAASDSRASSVAGKPAVAIASKEMSEKEKQNPYRSFDNDHCRDSRLGATLPMQVSLSNERYGFCFSFSDISFDAIATAGLPATLDARESEAAGKGSATPAAEGCSDWAGVAAFGRLSLRARSPSANSTALARLASRPASSCSCASRSSESRKSTRCCCSSAAHAEANCILFVRSSLDSAFASASSHRRSRRAASADSAATSATRLRSCCVSASASAWKADSAAT